MAKTKVNSTEVDAYIFIKENLKELGWDVRNPSRHQSGQVYTQNECLSHPEIKATLVLQKPENVVKITDTVFWVIEAKREHRQLEQALNEAEDYALLINKSLNIKVAFISGVVGNDTDGYLTKSRFLQGQRFRPIKINGKEVSALLSPVIAKLVLNDGPDIQDLPIDEHLFLSKAEKINEILHLGAINKNQRARVMAALLLALIGDTPPNIDAPPKVLINDINGRAADVLEKQNKADFYRYIEITLPATEDNHFKFKAALVRTIQELNNLNIRSAMNSGADVLGKLYEVFLKYGNGAKEIGIVLTPRHITKFAVETLNISDHDIVYDPTAGTGGFLVAALDYIKSTSTFSQIKRFKENNLFGQEQEAEVVALAIVNMIFRGDGKNKIIEGNCFQNNLIRATNGNILTAKYVSKRKASEEELVVTKVLMNPPFALRNSDEKEFKFVQHALEQMQDGGILFSILPYSTMVKAGSYGNWRRQMLLEKNTLLCVVTFPYELFYPVGVHTLGIFIKKGVSHPQGQNVLWIRAIQDGFFKKKGKRLPHISEPDTLSPTVGTIKAFLSNPNMLVANIDRFQRACPIDFADSLLELVPENYLSQEYPSEDSIKMGIRQVIKNSLGFLVQSEEQHET